MNNEKGRLFCPYCRLELKNGAHINEVEAWDRFNCEYNSSDCDELPITELEMNKSEITRLTKLRNSANKSIKALKARNLELTAI